MQQRERRLAQITGIVALIAAVQFGYTFIQGAFDERQSRIGALEQDLTDKGSAQIRGKRAKKRIEEWNKRSLPSNLDRARSLYQNWLANKVEDLRLAKAEVSSGPAIPRQGIYNRLPFMVRGQGNLGQITQLLYEFYRADHLHQVQRLSLTPIAAPGGDASAQASMPSAAGEQTAQPAFGPPGGFGPGMFGMRGMFGGRGMPGMDQMTLFDISMSIEALVLPGADRSDQLNAAASKRLAFEELDDYRRPITRRNIFAPYVERPQSGDESQDAYITAVMKVDGRLQAWLSFRNLGMIRKLREGDRVDVGSVHATVVTIREQAIEIESDGKRRKVSLGSSLAESQELSKAESASKSSGAAAPAKDIPPPEAAAAGASGAALPAKRIPADDESG
jgi:hypothetical protein